MSRDAPDTVALAPALVPAVVSKLSDGLVEIRDFQTTCVVAFARGCPFFDLPSGRLDVMGQRVQVKEEYRLNCVEAMEDLVSKL